jgi:hypothetical protein
MFCIGVHSTLESDKQAIVINSPDCSILKEVWHQRQALSGPKVKKHRLSDAGLSGCGKSKPQSSGNTTPKADSCAGSGRINYGDNSASDTRLGKIDKIPQKCRHESDGVLFCLEEI